jgi:site-specific DNA recombinase
LIRAAVYCRVSSEIQKERASIETQRQFAIQYCQAQGIEVVDIFADDGVSGTIPLNERPEGARMLHSAKAKRFTVLLIFRLDRLARSTMDILRTVELLKASEIVIRSLTEPFETETATGKFLLSMLASVAELERDGIADRTRAGMERHAREGRWLGGRAPFGYQIIDRRLAVHPEQSAIVKEIFGWYLSGDRVRGIAARLNTLGIKHPSDWTKPISRVWYEATVCAVLHGRCYVGEWEWRKRTDRKKVHGKTTFKITPPEQRIPVSIPSLVSIEDFDRVQETMKANFAFAPRNTKYPYLLRALIMCGECGRRYVGLGSGRPRWYKHFYRCSSHVSAAGRLPCAGRGVRADQLDEMVWEQCIGFINNPGAILEELRAAMSYQQFSQGDIRSEVVQMDSALMVKTKERARVITLIRRGSISDAEGDHELALLQSEVAQLTRQRDALLSRQSIAEDREMRVLTAEAMLTLLADKAASANFETRREIACAFVNGITIRTVENKPIAEVCYIFQPSPSVLSERNSGQLEGVDCVGVGLATSRARFTESWPRTSRKSTL